MKSTKILVTSLVLSLLVGTISVVALASQTRKVTVTSEVLFGNASNVSNLTLNMKTTMQNFHIWDIKTPIAMPEKSHIDYKLHSKRQYVSGEVLEYVYLDFVKNFSASTSDIFTFNEEDMSIHERDFKRPDLAIKDVASRAEANSKHTEVIALKDYYEFYPLGFEYFIAIKSDENDEIIWDFSDSSIIKMEDYFKIPVRDGMLEISVTKNDLGVNKIECKSVGVETEIISYSVVLDDKIFLAIEVQEIDNHEVTRIGNTQMYQLDIFAKDGYIEISDITKIKTFDDGIYLDGFIEFDDFLVTLENKSAKSEVVVYSKADFTELQRISIADTGYYMENLSNAILIHHAHDIFTVITQENGVFKEQFDGKFEQILELDKDNYYYDAKTFFVDNQLITLSEYRKPNNPMGDIVMMVYNQDGLQFSSKYSLSQAEDVDEHSNISIYFEDFYVE